MLKKEGKHLETWVFILTGIISHQVTMNELMKFSPFYSLHNHNPALPIDNIPKPKSKYLREPHMIGMEQQHKAFILVQQHLKRQK